MKYFFLAALFLTVEAPAFTQLRTGLYYNVGGKSESPLFRQESKIEIIDDGNRTSFAEIFDAKGNLVMRETATVQNGIITSQVMEQLQIKERYELQVKNKTAIFKTYGPKDGKDYQLIDSNEVKIGEGFATGPSLELLLKKNLKELTAKKSVTFDFGIFELSKPLGFRAQQTEKVFSGELGLLPVKLRVASFFVSLFASPLYLEIDPETAALRRYRGRTPVRILKDGKLTAFDADIYFEIKESRP